MVELTRVGDLEINQDLDYQRRAWRWQRVGLTAMACVLVAGLLGLFGAGPLSRATVAEGGGRLAVEYERFARYEKPQQLRVRLAGGTAEGGEVRVILDRRYAEDMQVERATPPPERVESAAGDLVHVFRAADAGQGATLVFYCTPQRFGRLRGRVALPAGGPALTFTQFIYP